MTTKTAKEITDKAILDHEPIAIFAGFSGGTDSLAVTHWLFEEYGSRYPVYAFHANTGIGIEKTREFVRDTCKDYNWPLIEIRAKEDCGQDYDELVREHGFPGPDHHRKMYNRLKERCVKKLARDTKKKWSDRIIIATGIRHDESLIRAGYKGREINRDGSQVWVNPIYYWTGSDKAAYIRKKGLPTNAVSQTLGMSGECLCGAFASKGEKALVRLIDPEVAERIDSLERECLAKGFTWGWEGAPPKGGYNPDQSFFDFDTTDQPMCVDCNKAGRGKYDY